MANANGMEAKLERLRALLRETGGIAVAFSSGVDSTFLLKVTHEELGERVIAVTARSHSFPKREQDEAAAFCAREGIRQVVVVSEELAVPGFQQNPPNRCYLCKKELFTKILEIAKSEGLSAVAEGSNMDDLGDYRPGLQAIRELGIKSAQRVYYSPEWTYLFFCMGLIIPFQESQKAPPRVSKIPLSSHTASHNPTTNH